MWSCARRRLFASVSSDEPYPLNGSRVEVEGTETYAAMHGSPGKLHKAGGMADLDQRAICGNLQDRPVNVAPTRTAAEVLMDMQHRSPPRRPRPRTRASSIPSSPAHPKRPTPRDGPAQDQPRRQRPSRPRPRRRPRTLPRAARHNCPTQARSSNPSRGRRPQRARTESQHGRRSKLERAPLLRCPTFLLLRRLRVRYYAAFIFAFFY